MPLPARSGQCHLWSNAIDLSTRSFKFYQNHDFSHPVLIDLNLELEKVSRQVPIKDLFPQPLVDWVKQHGVSVSSLQEVDPGRTDSMHEWSDAGGFLLFDGRTADAVLLFREATRRFPALARAYSELGIALQADGKVDEAKVMYARALAIDPSDHCDNLFAGGGTKVAFRLHRFLTADQVTVVGNFSGELEETIKLHKDKNNVAWVAEIPARPGTHI
jgi:tetratricopeptide (TPR) repeat protein